MSVEATLAERGRRYGDFADHARIAQDLQDAMRYKTNWGGLSPVQKQALTVIADKIARILSGDPNYGDNWHDIQGYARLVEERLAPDFVFQVPENPVFNPGPVVIDEPPFTMTIRDETGTHPYIQKCCKYPNPSTKSEIGGHQHCLNCNRQLT